LVGVGGITSGAAAAFLAGVAPVWIFAGGVVVLVAVVAGIAYEDRGRTSPGSLAQIVRAILDDLRGER